MLGLAWRPSARRRLDHLILIQYIADRDRAAAARLSARILEAIRMAREHPEMYRVGRMPNTREIVAHPNYIVVYTVLPDRIRVVSVLHARQKYPWPARIIPSLSRIVETRQSR